MNGRAYNVDSRGSAKELSQLGMLGVICDDESDEDSDDERHRRSRAFIPISRVSVHMFLTSVIQKIVAQVAIFLMVHSFKYIHHKKLN